MAITFKSWKGLILPIAALVLLASCDSNDDADDEAYLPEVDDTAILFIHKFNPTDYEEGKDIVVDGFSEAIEVSGQTRRTYFSAGRIVPR